MSDDLKTGEVVIELLWNRKPLYVLQFFRPLCRRKTGPLQANNRQELSDAAILCRATHNIAGKVAVTTVELEMGYYEAQKYSDIYYKAMTASRSRSGVRNASGDSEELTKTDISTGDYDHFETTRK